MSVFLAFFLLAGAPPEAQEALSREQVFAVLDTFDTLDTSRLPFVKVATGRWVQYDAKPPQNRYRFGFLVREDEEQLTVRYLDLTRETLKTTPEGTPEHERIGVTIQDIAEHAREIGARLAKAGDDDRALGRY